MANKPTAKLTGLVDKLGAERVAKLLRTMLYQDESGVTKVEEAPNTEVEPNKYERQMIVPVTKSKFKQ